MDIRDLILEAQAEVQATIREALMELLQPQIMAQVKAIWFNAPDDVKEKFKRERPQDYAALMNELRR